MGHSAIKNGISCKSMLENPDTLWYSIICYCQYRRKERYKVQLFLTILQLISAIAITAIVLMQSGKRSGLSGAIAGGADTFLSKGKAKTLDAKLAKATKWVGLAFVVLTLALHFV